MPIKTARFLIGGGVFCLSLAALSLTLVQPALLKAPLQKATTTVSQGPATALDSATGRQVSGTFTQKRIVGTHVVKSGTRSEVPGNDSTALYDDYTESSFVSSDGTFTRDFGKTLQTQAFNRNTGSGRPGFRGDTVASTAHFFKLPFGTEKKSYLMWNTKAIKAYPATFVRETEIRGVRTFEFHQIVPPTDLGPLPVVKAIPGALVGDPSTPSIPANQWVEDPDQRYFVEPASGAIVSGSSRAHIYAQTVDGRKVDLLTLNGVTPSPTSQTQLVNDAQDAQASVSLLRTIPLVAAIVGLLLLGAGLVLLRRGDRQELADDEAYDLTEDAPREIDLRDQPNRVTLVSPASNGVRSWSQPQPQSQPQSQPPLRPQSPATPESTAAPDSPAQQQQTSPSQTPARPADGTRPQD